MTCEDCKEKIFERRQQINKVLSGDTSEDNYVLHYRADHDDFEVSGTIYGLKYVMEAFKEFGLDVYFHDGRLLICPDFKGVR